MEKTTSISWKTFKETLIQNPELNLHFQYDGNKLVNASYHITEIKQAEIVSVDCGGVMNNWTEIIVQLWEPGGFGQENAMKTGKALKIINLVEKTLRLNPMGTVKIEFGNSEFDTRQMFPNEIMAEGENLVINLNADTVQCKAIERGGNCGTAKDEAECCTTPDAKPKPVLKNLAATACCEPGCCA